MYELRFPIGEFKKPETITAQHLEQWLNDIETFPGAIRLEVQDLTPEQLDTQYRPGGWTIRQVVHHCADSHVNSFIRLKLALTEEKPIVKPYYEDRWAELADAKTMPVEPSLQIIEGLHSRWAALLKTFNEKDLSRTFFHPEQNREIRVDENIGFYAWHSNHHLAHIISLKESKGWKQK